MSLHNSLELQHSEQLESVIKQIVDLLDANSGGIYQFDRVQQELILTSGFPNRDDAEHLFGARLKIDEGVAESLIYAQEHYRYTPDYSRQPSQFSSKTFNSVIEMRLEYDHERLGILYINDDRAGRIYSDRDIEILTACCNCASTILYDLKQITQATYHRTRLEKLLETNRNVMSELSISEGEDWREQLDQVIDSIVVILEAETGGFFGVEGDELILIDSYGEDPEHYSVGRSFKIIDGEKTGLTGAIAARGEIYNEYGDRLTGDPAVKGGPSHTPSGKCYSLLMVPIEIRQFHENERRIVAWLRVDNKKDRFGNVDPSYYFNGDDVAILLRLADALAVAIRANVLLNELNQFFLVAPDPIIMVDRAGKIVRSNKRAQELTGYSKQELLRLSVKDIYSDPNVAITIGALLHRSGIVLEYKTGIQSEEGYNIPIHLNAASLYDARQRYVGSVGYFEDLRELYSERNLLRRLIDAAPVYIYAKDMESKFLAANLEIAARMGVGHPRDLIGKTDADYYEMNLAKKYVKDEKEVIESGESIKDTELTKDLGTGEDRWLSTVKSPLRNYNDEIIGVVGIGQDITDDHNRQEKIERLFASSANLLNIVVPGDVLDIAVRQIYEVEKAQAVKLILIDDEDQSYELFTAGHFEVANSEERVRSNGISLFVKHECEKLIIPDTKQYKSSGKQPPTIHPDMYMNDIGSAVCLPVTSQQKTIGVLWIHYADPQDFKDEDIQIIRMYLNQAASTYGLLQQLQHEQAVANILPELTRPETLLWKEIAEGAHTALKADEVAVYSYDWQRDEIDTNPIVIGNSHWKEDVSRLNVVTEVVKQGSTLSVSKAPNGGGRPRSMPSNIQSVKSYIAAPIRQKHDLYPLGAICVSYESMRIFYMEDKTALEKYAERAALILSNAKLHQQIAHQQQKLDRLQQASRVIVESNDSMEILHKVASQALLLIDNGIETETQQSQCFSYVGLVKDSETLEFVAAYPPDRLNWLNAKLQEHFGKPTIQAFAESSENFGISAKVCRNGKQIIVDDVLQHDEYLMLEPETRSQLSIPLKRGANILGVLTVEHQTPHAFSIEDANRLQTLGNQAAAAIDRLWRLKQNSDAFQIIANTTYLEDAETEDLMLTRIAKAIQEILKCDLVSIYVLDQITGKKISLGAIVGAKTQPPRRLEFFEDDSLLAQILKEGKPQFIYDDSPDYIQSSFVREEGIRSFIAVPLEANDRKVGVLFASYRVRKKLKTKLQDVIQLAIPAAVAIQNIQLLVKERHLRIQAETLNRINRILDKINQADELKDISGEILDALGEYVRYERATFQLIQGDRRRLLNYKNLDERNISQHLLGPVSTDKLVRRILKTGEITILSDLTDEQVREDWGWGIFPETEDIKSWIGIPLIFGEEKNRKPVGFITLDHTIPGYYSASDKDLREIIDIFARQASIAIQKAQLNNGLKTLDDIGNQLSRSLLEHEIPTRVYKLTSRLMDTSNFFFGLYNRHTNQVDIKVWYRNQELLEAQSYTLQGFTKYILETGQAFLVRDLDEETATLPVQPAIITERQLSWLGVPIISPSKAEIIGIISTQSPERNAFDEFDRHLLQIVATWTGIALERAQSLATGRPRQHTQVDTLHKYLPSNNEEQLYVSIIGWCEQIMDDADLVEIRLMDFNTNELVTWASNNSAVKSEYKRVAKGRGVTGWVAEHGVARMINDLHKYEEEYLAFIDGMQSELAVPIFDRWHHVVGVLNIEHAEANKFSSGNRIIAEAIAGLVGIIIESSRLNHYLNTELANIAEREREIILDSVESDLIHAIRNLAGLITPRTTMIRGLLNEQGIKNDELSDFLDKIDDEARRIITEVPRLKEMLTGSNYVDLRVLVGNCVTDAELMAVNVTFLYEAEESELPVIVGNKRLLSTAIDSIIHNAIIAVQSYDIKKPTIEVLVNATRDDRNDVSGINISVTDNGPGINDLDRERIFEYGYSSWDESGYGLWRARMIVQKFGGHILLETPASGSGVTFTIFFPIPQHEKTPK